MICDKIKNIIVSLYLKKARPDVLSDFAISFGKLIREQLSDEGDCRRLFKIERIK